MENNDELLDELLTPLAVMKGAISIVLKHGDRLTPQERSKWLELAIAQSDELNELVVKMESARPTDDIKLTGPVALAIGEDAPAPPPSPAR